MKIFNKFCNITGKKNLIGNKISFSKKRNKRLFKINLKKKFFFNKKIFLSVKCLKKLKKINNFINF